MDIGIWGDSITYGAGDSKALGWVGRLRKSYDKDSEVNVYNFGVCGDTTNDLLRRFDGEAASVDPNVVIFSIGINDSKYPVNQKNNLVAIEDFEENMNTLVRCAKKYTRKIYLISATKVQEHLKEDAAFLFENTEIQRYNSVLQTISQSENILYVDVFPVLDTRRDLADGLHPNAQGYQKMYTTISKALEIGK